MGRADVDARKCARVGQQEVAAGFRLVIGSDGGLRRWVRVANALLDCIPSGAAFRALASEGVLHWAPGEGYYVQASFTVVVDDRYRGADGLSTVLPGGRR